MPQITNGIQLSSVPRWRVCSIIQAGSPRRCSVASA